MHRPTAPPPLRWDPSWPADKPITSHPDFDTQLVNDPDELALFREFGSAPMGGSSGITGALAYHPRFMLAPSDERRYEVLADFLADAATAEREERLDDFEAKIARIVARLLMRFSQELRLPDVARLADCTRVDAWRAIASLSRAGLLVEIQLDADEDVTHVMFVHDGVARMSTIYDRGPGWIAESAATFDREEAEEAAEREVGT